MTRNEADALAAQLLADIHPELAAHFAARAKLGRPKSDDIDRLADQWQRIAAQASKGQKVRHVIKALAARTVDDGGERFWVNVWKLRGRDDIKAELIKRGVDYREIWAAVKF